MSSTIESTNNNILEKLHALKTLICMLESNGISIDERAKHHAKEIQDDYELGSISLLSEYYDVLSKHNLNANHLLDKSMQNADRDRCYGAYHSFIRKENFVGRMDNVFKRIIRHAKKNNVGGKVGSAKGCNFESTVFDLIKMYEHSSFAKRIKEVPYELCDKCGIRMTVVSNTSELICETCGTITSLSGTVFEDDQFYYQEGQRTKHGNYDPTKHCRIWIERIQARETTDIPDSVINGVKGCIHRDKIRDASRITCAQIRKYLQHDQNSKYNEHVPLIRKLITGIIPPQLNDTELQLINIYFDKVIRIFEEVKPSGKTNCP